jgi:hypothetical protein
MSGGLVGPELYGQISDTIRAVKTGRMRSVESQSKAAAKLAGRLVPHAVVLDENLPAAADGKLTPSSALATVLRWSVAQSQYLETDLQIKVWNHSEATSFGIDTLGKADPIDGHYWFFGDCAAMADREAMPAPPPDPPGDP